MLTSEEIEALVNLRDKEKINLELKSLRILTKKAEYKDRLQQLGSAIVGLVNKYGGKLILGVNDDGTFDGKFNGNPDWIKGQIHSICRDMISPAVDFEIQFIEADKWDVFVVFISKRKNIPHAYIKRKGHEILERVYYTRTAHGKKLMTDVELEWMFKNQEDPIYSSSFRFSLEFTKSLEAIMPKGFFLPGYWKVNNYLNWLSPKDKELITAKNENFAAFILELAPYLILSSFPVFFRHSWYIGMHEEFERASWGPMNEPVLSDFVSVPEIPFSGRTIFDRLSWNFSDVLRSNILNDRRFSVPVGTIVRVAKEDDNTSKIFFENPKFTFEILIGSLGYGSGLNPKNPGYEVALERDPVEAQNHAMEHYFHFDAAGRFKADFNLEYEIDEFKKIEHFYNSIKKVITKEWDFNTILKSLPPKDTRVMHSKVDNILNAVTIIYSQLNKD